MTTDKSVRQIAVSVAPSETPGAYTIEVSAEQIRGMATGIHDVGFPFGEDNPFNELPDRIKDALRLCEGFEGDFEGRVDPIAMIQNHGGVLTFRAA